MASSKRSLYKPATLQDVGSQEQRRGLAQGRLVSKPVLPDTMTVFASPRDFSLNTSNTDTGDLSVTLSHSGYPLEGTLTPPKQSLARVMADRGRRTRDDDMNQSKPSQFSSQSRTTHVVPPSSPPKPTPSAVLELSDTENDPNYRTAKSPVLHVRHLTPSPVLYVDASGGRLDPDRSEVETNTDLVVSPAKVICHAPAVVESDLRDTGYTQETARIRVDAVPTVSLLGDLDVTQVKGDKGLTHPDASRQKGGSRTPLVVKENTLAGTSREKSESSRIGDSSREGDENVSVGAKTGSAVKDKKKKKRAMIVPSRYMQAASKPTTARSNSLGEMTTVPTRPRNSSSAVPSRGALTKKSASKPSYAKRTVSSSAAQQPTTKPSHSQGSRSISQSHYSYTPMPRGIHRVGGVTSTPAVNAPTIPPAGSLDASAIGSSMIQGPDVSIAMAPPSGVAMSLAGRLDSARDMPHREELSAADTSLFQSAMSTSAGQDSAYVSMPTTHKKKRAVEITQDYLDRVYARYTQALFLDSKLEKTLKEQEKEAMSQMYGLWHENEKLRSRKRELELELASSRHANRLDQQLDGQISGLGPVVAHLDQLKRQYSTLAHALDTTRHQLGTTGIHVPQDEDGYHESLISALAESENLLGEISAATRTHQPKITSFASAIQALQKAVDNEDRELKRCQELLSATCTLATQESSLRIQQIEQ